MTKDILLVNLKILVDSRQSCFFYYIPTRNKNKQSFHFKIPNIVTKYVGRYT